MRHNLTRETSRQIRLPLDFRHHLCYDVQNKGGIAMSQTAKGKLMNLSAMVIFGTIGVFVRQISLPSSLIALVRGGVGLLFLAAVLVLRHQKPDFEAIRDNLPVLLLSGVFLGANWIALFEAYRYTSVATATMCYYMAPIIVLLLSPILLKEKLAPTSLLCVALSLLGMFLITGLGEKSASNSRGIAFGLLAAALYAGVILSNRKLRSVGSFDTTLVQLAASALVLMPYTLLTEDVAGLSFPGSALALLILLGIIHTGLAYTLYFGSIRHLPAKTIALYSYIDPILSVILSALLLKEPLTPAGILGAGLVLASTALSELRK